jgi:plasmid maintenance system antidote protein VapI
MEAGFWLRLQSDWDLWHVLRGRRPRLHIKPLSATA